MRQIVTYTILLVSISVLNTFSLFAQLSNDNQKDYYYEIPDHPKEYTAHTVAARMVDALGFRYYWASKGLRKEDLAYKPSKDGRTTGETIDHIYGLVKVLLNAVEQKTNSGAGDLSQYSFEEKREITLVNIQKVSELLKGDSSAQLKECPAIFKNGERTIELPFWNLLNGPLADAIYHVGQIVVLRRNSGNPVNPNLNQFTGKVKEN